LVVGQVILNKNS